MVPICFYDKRREEILCLFDQVFAQLCAGEFLGHGLGICGVRDVEGLRHVFRHVCLIALNDEAQI